jgi:L-arabinose isomerase
MSTESHSLRINRPSEAQSSRPTIGLVAGGLGAYWPQFPLLLPQLRQSSSFVSQRITGFDANVVDVGFISDALEANEAAEKLRVADCDLIVMFLTTYMTATMVVPIALRTGADILFINLQPSEKMDHDSFDTGAWLAYCGACPLPEMANTFERSGLTFRSVSGFLHDERAWARIENWVRAASVKRILRRGRHGLLGHLYPGMYDVSTDLTLIPAHFGGHVEVLEIDDLRVRVAEVKDDDVRLALTEVKDAFEIDASVDPVDLDWSVRVAIGMDNMVRDFSLDSLAYYHRGLEGEMHERVAAGMILGASLLTAAHVPACGEYELRASLAMLILDRMGSGGSFTELQALNFEDGVVEMGHDGPAHLAISERKPVLRGLGVFHGKRGWGVSVEFDVRHGPVTVLGLTQMRDGSFRFVASEGEVVAGPLLQIGNTTSRVDFGRDPGEWCDAWSATAVAHHWALGVGHRINELSVISDLLGVKLITV